MTQITNQGEMFYRMKYLGGDTPAYHASGNKFQELIEHELYEVYLSRTVENEASPHWVLDVYVPGEGNVYIHYWSIEDFVEEWEDI